MNAHAPVRALRIAVLAMGGEGGGVLADWICDLAEHGGYVAQMTSVPGVAQRTGATIYYIEAFPAAARARGREPVLALMPVPGDVDLVVASELMEAGRAVQRGLVTPDRTTLVTSTHRVFAIAEKVALADGRVDDRALLDACRGAARTFVAADLAEIAAKTGSVISAAMFGALASSGALPFTREDFERTIERGGVGVNASKRAFAAAFDAASGKAVKLDPVPLDVPLPSLGSVDALAVEAEKLFPATAMAVIRAGIERVVDHQDVDYGRHYLERLRRIAEVDRRHGDGSARLLAETARYLALGMAYEDTIRVAELKTRASRFKRVADEVMLKDGQVLQIREYLHPRLQEIAETLPAPLGRLLLRTRFLRNMVEQMTSQGRIVETTSIRGFSMLYCVAGLKRWRRMSLRWPQEQAALDDWLALVASTAEGDYALAVELAECRNLVKGYGDTHARGQASYGAITGALTLLAGKPTAAARVAELRRAALADETGAKLKDALAKLTSQDTQRA